MNDAPENLFDPALYAPTRRPPLEARPLPAWCYTSEAFFRAERERLFRHGWLFVGREDQVTAPGDYITRQPAGVPIVVLRDRGGAVRALANSCRHRGSLLLEGDGNCRAIKCPYHGWVYGLDGTLQGAPDMDESEGFRKEDHGLAPLRLEARAGFMFVNLDPGAPSLAEWLGDLPLRFAPYRLEDMVTTRRREYEVACNWKPVLEAFSEDYHLKSVHGDTIGLNYKHPRPADLCDGEALTLFAPHEGTGAIIPRPGQKTLPMIPTLTGELTAGTLYGFVFPAFMFAATIDCMWAFEFYPLGPARTRFAMNFCFPRATAAAPDFEEIVAAYYERWHIAILEDNRTTERQQKGLASPLARPGRYSWLETGVAHFNRWIAERMADDTRVAAD